MRVPFLAAIRSAWRWLLDGSSYQILDGVWCEDCRDIHESAAACPRVMTGYCVDCEMTRVLDRYGNCRLCGSHAIANRWSLRSVKAVNLRLVESPAPTHGDGSPAPAA